jgi:hypothetical protein
MTDQRLQDKTRDQKEWQRAQDLKRADEKRLPTEPFIFSLKNVWDKPPTLLRPTTPGDKNGVIADGTHSHYRGDAPRVCSQHHKQQLAVDCGDQDLIWASLVTQAIRHLQHGNLSQPSFTLFILTQVIVVGIGAG